MSEKIYFYKTNEEHGYMSNFSRHSLIVNGIEYKTSEHYFQSKKAEGTPYEQTIINATKPSEAAKLGRSRDFKLREDWEQIKDNVMRDAVQTKFLQNPTLWDKLLKTGDAILIEATSDDYYWGVGTNGTGKNMLGIILMELREEIKKNPDITLFKGKKWIL